ncbi:response regulator transcription factor [Streptomyces fulvoviolaceus]|uniref:response regulator transcription factor n=1 Tax=Streptomyces fulvoviolaceus TaxID=285535 RepID=UPI0004C7DB4F|nr:response regulator transcription factor [Streptomyces fulvoviolaceus]MCT9075737.1 response regulator transcription factor [Streptomyces fulvoviolaceus]
MYGSPSEKPALARGAGQHLLIVVGDTDVAELLSTMLELAGYTVGVVATAAEAPARLAKQSYDLVVLDSSLPDVADLGRDRPALEHRPPVLLLVEYDSLDQLVPELGLGERDYVTKPFRVGEVLARVQVLLRGAGSGRSGDGALSYRDLVLDDSLCQARRGPRSLDLTPAEYRLLRHLLVNAHRVLSKEQIGRYVWGDYHGDNAIEQLVSRLRRKVDRAAPVLIHTRRGFGYWLGSADVES